DQVAAGSVQYGSDVGGGAGEPAEGAACGHAANVDARISVVILHADAVAENRSARVGARGIDRDDAQRLAFAPVELRELVNQRALPRPGCAGHAEDARSEEHTSELQSPCNLVCR